MKIMIVDDSAIIRRAIGRSLGPLGLELAATASDGAEALEKLDQVQPDLVTLDITMPRLDGLECLRQILARRPATKVLVVSALSDPATGLKALRLGAKAFLPKPFTEAQLSGEVRRLIGGLP